jgi:peptide/nickel transport system substrate-binding protein
MAEEMNRREFLRSSALTAAGIALAACAKTEEPPAPTATTAAAAPTATTAAAAPTATTAAAAPTATTAPAEPTATPEPAGPSALQAPQWQDQVAAGLLREVDERLPGMPMVVTPVERIGKYGGDWGMGTLGVADSMIFDRNNEYDNLVAWNIEWTVLLPGLATGWEFRDEGKTTVFSLRRGMKWSDGEPFTADDFVFWWEEASDTDLNPSFPSMWTTYGDPVVVTKDDDYTVAFTYTYPYGLFLQQLGRSGSRLYSCRHYREQFFPGYADPAVIDQKIQDSGVTYWYEAYGNWTNPLQNPDHPVVYAWLYTSVLGDNPAFIATRNPYCYKVDPDGNQLPYIDRQIYTLAGDQQAIVMMAIAGDIDCQDRHIASLPNKALFAENAQAADIRFVDVKPSSMNACIIPLNLTNSDLVKRELFQKKDFRIALSIAINRQEIIDVVNLGVGEPWQCAPLPESPLYNETLAKQYTEYDPAQANEILDGIIPDRDNEGFRTMPDGSTLGIVVEVQGSQTDRISILELVKSYWEAVGVRMAIKPEDRSLLFERRAGNDWDAAVWGGDGGMDFMLWPKNYFAQHVGSWYGPAWTAWYNTRGKEGEEPPASMRTQMDLYDQILVTPDEAGQNEMMAEILRIAQEEFWCMGTYRSEDGYMVVKNQFRNVPEWHWSSGGTYPDPGPCQTPHFFWDV